MAPTFVSVRIRSSCWLILATALAACTESSASGWDILRSRVLYGWSIVTAM